MQQFDAQLVQIMRAALEDIMTKLPVEYCTPATKAYLAECILKAAAAGQTSYDALVSVGAEHIQVALTLLT